MDDNSEASVASALESHILSLTAAIGALEDTTASDDTTPRRSYVLGIESIECLRDIKRFLRNDEANNTKLVSNLVGKWEVVQNHLVPIVVYHSENRPIFFAAIELLVPLTWPLRPDQFSADLIQHHRSYKLAIVDSSAIDVLFDYLLILIASPNQLPDNRAGPIIRLIFLLIRNLLAIPDPVSEPSKGADSHRMSSLHETLVKKLASVEFLEFCVVAASNINDRVISSMNTILVEIFFLIFCSVSPSALCKSDTIHHLDYLTPLLQKEADGKLIPRQRHSRFAANFTLMQGNNKLFVQGLQSNMDSLNNTKQKNTTRPSFKKGRAPTQMIEMSLACTGSMNWSRAHASVLHTIAQRVLRFGFDPLVVSAKRDIDAEKQHVRDEDPIHLIYLMQFFLQYQRMSDLKVGYLSSILNVHGLLFLLKNMRVASEIRNHALLHVTLSCISEFLVTVKDMLHCTDASNRALASNILDNLYYDQANLDMFVGIFRVRKAHSWRHLIAMIEVVHHLLGVLELRNAGQKSMKVRRRKRRSKASKTAAADQESPASHSDSDSSTQYVDRDLSFDQIESMFCADNVVDKYLTALSRLDDLSADQVYAVTKMLHRMVVKQNQVPLFFKLNYLNVIHKVLSDSTVIRLSRGPCINNPGRHSKYSLEAIVPKLIGILKLVVNQFFGCLDKYPLMLVDALFPHTRADLDRFQTGNKASHLDTSVHDVACAPDWSVDADVPIRPSLKKRIRAAVKTVLRGNDGEVILDRFLEALSHLASLRMNVDDNATANWPNEMLSIPPSDLFLDEMQHLTKVLGLKILSLGEEPDASTGHVLNSVSVPGTLGGPALNRIIDTVMESRVGRKKKSGSRAKGSRSAKVSSSRRDVVDEEDTAPIIKSVAIIYDSEDLLQGSDDEAFRAKEEACRKYTREIYQAVSGDFNRASPGQIGGGFIDRRMRSGLSESDGSQVELDDFVVHAHSPPL